MIGYSGIYSPNNKKNQESIAIRLVYSQNSENRESRNYKCMAFSGFSLPNCDLCPSPMIKYSFFKNHRFLRRLFQLLSFNSSFVLSAKNRGILIKLPSCFKFSIEYRIQQAGWKSFSS